MNQFVCFFAMAYKDSRAKENSRKKSGQEVGIRKVLILSLLYERWLESHVNVTPTTFRLMDGWSYMRM